MPQQSTSSSSPAALPPPPALPRDVSETVRVVNGRQQGILGTSSGVGEKSVGLSPRSSVDERKVTTAGSSPPPYEHDDESTTVNADGRVGGGSAGVSDHTSSLSGGGASRVDSILAAAKKASQGAQSSSIAGLPEVGGGRGKRTHIWIFLYSFPPTLIQMLFFSYLLCPPLQYG